MAGNDPAVCDLLYHIYFIKGTFWLQAAAGMESTGRTANAETEPRQRYGSKSIYGADRYFCRDPADHPVQIQVVPLPAEKMVPFPGAGMVPYSFYISSGLPDKVIHGAVYHYYAADVIMAH